MPSPANTTEPDAPRGPVPCFDCDGDTRRVWDEHTFTYGIGDAAAELTVHLPVHVCPSCGFECLDHEAETLKHEAVCAHLGVLTPDEVRGIRTMYGKSRAAFAKVTGLGEATLNRWENALLIQNTANDRYLRLLRNANNMRLLERLTAEPVRPSSTASAGRFRAIDESAEQRQQPTDFFGRRAA